MNTPENLGTNERCFGHNSLETNHLCEQFGPQLARTHHMTSKRSCETNMKRGLFGSLCELGTTILRPLNIKPSLDNKYTVNFRFNLLHTVNGIPKDSALYALYKQIYSFANPLSKARTSSILMIRRLSSESNIFSKISAYEAFSS